jgi:Lrp/AsnC family transcriptional regulator, regulator for asnA, asnC and gidA
MQSDDGADCVRCWPRSRASAKGPRGGAAGLARRSSIYDDTMPDSALDDLDRAIISELQEDGRRAFREISRSLGVSEGTVRGRVRRLEDAGILKIAAFVDPKESANSRLAIVLISVEPEARVELTEFLCSQQQVSYVSTLLGSADIFAQLLVRDETSLWNFVQTQLRSRPGVKNVDFWFEVELNKLWFDSHPAVL